MLTGYKTYISAFLLFLIGGAFYTGVIDSKTAETLAILLTGGGLASLRSAVANVEKKV